MHKMFVVLFFALAATLSGGCRAPQPKMISEDIDVLKVYADDIAILKNPQLGTNSEAKFTAARRLAEGVDFTLTRNVKTLDQIFLPRDARLSHTPEYGDEIAFYYQYQDNYVRFRFWRSANMISHSEVRIKAE